MAALTPAFLDTSILVAGLIELGPVSEFPQRIMAAVAAGQIRSVITAWHCCLEFYSVATRLPEEFRLAPGDALLLLEAEVLERVQVRQLPEGERRPFLRALPHEGVIGGRIYDAHIAQTARRAGARVVVTDNVRHFALLRRHDIDVLSAEAYAHAARLTR